MFIKFVKFIGGEEDSVIFINNGFSINNCREKFLGKDISSNFDLYVLFKNNKEAIIENIKKFNDLIYQSLKSF